MGVYGLNMFPEFMPLAQPRVQLKDHDPVPINVPLPTLEEIAAARSMSDLPFIDYDRYFVPGSWELHRWRYMYNSYLFRLYTTWFPLKRTEQRGDSEEAINHELLRSFLRTSKSDGSIPLVLYLPDKDDYRDPVHKEMPSLKTLRTSGVDYVDLRSCLDTVDANHRFAQTPRYLGDDRRVVGARAGSDVELPLVRGARDRRPRELPVPHRPAFVGTAVLHRVDDALDVEQRDRLARNPDHLRPTRRNLRDLDHRDEPALHLHSLSSELAACLAGHDAR